MGTHTSRKKICLTAQSLVSIIAHKDVINTLHSSSICSMFPLPSDGISDAQASYLAG